MRMTEILQEWRLRRSCSLDRDRVGFHHVPHKCLKARLVMPAELGACFACIPEKMVDFGGPKIARVDLDQHFAVAFIDCTR
jgi:hypothetical protein